MAKPDKPAADKPELLKPSRDVPFTEYETAMLIEARAQTLLLFNLSRAALADTQPAVTVNYEAHRQLRDLAPNAAQATGADLYVPPLPSSMYSDNDN